MSAPHNLAIEISALRTGWDQWCEEYIALHDKCIKYEIDAARYRFLRNGHERFEVTEHFRDDSRRAMTRLGVPLDAAIDAAMKSEAAAVEES